jgi:hypothetical protein
MKFNNSTLEKSPSYSLGIIRDREIFPEIGVSYFPDNHILLLKFSRKNAKKEIAPDHFTLPQAAGMAC